MLSEMCGKYASKDEDRRIRLLAVKGLARLGQTFRDPSMPSLRNRAMKLLQPASKDQDQEVAREAQSALSTMKSAER